MGRFALYLTMALAVDPSKYGFLNPHDAVAISFWIISIAMVAATVFFLMESTAVSYNWKTSMNVGALVTLVAAVHYFYMREFWVLIHGSPILYRYIDWSITVPLQMIEFYLILSAVQPSLGGAMFWRLMLGTCWMLAWGYMGESGTMYGIMGPGIGCFIAFILGLSGWFYILAEISAGEMGQVAASGNVNKHVARRSRPCLAGGGPHLSGMMREAWQERVLSGLRATPAPRARD